MTLPRLISLLATSWLAMLGVAESTGQTPAPLRWPEMTKASLPGTRWWWMGSAVNPADLARELKIFREAGLGTVEITPIYGVKGREKESIEYLSSTWMERLKVAVAEAQKLEMNVDMATGTGWCFGGPNVSDEDANATVVEQHFDLAPGASLTEKFHGDAIQALVAFSPVGGSVNLTDEIGEDGQVDWKAPTGSGPWRVYAISQKPSGVKVKRPAPGGDGWMLNLLYPDAMTRYLENFSAAFQKYEGPKPHAQFHDSYEYRSNWAPDFFAQFEKRRGYKLETELPALLDAQGDRDHVARVKCDYRETVSELIEESITRWTNWSHDLGSLSRNQAHGSPGNWLDIYAASDIPETEMFYTDRDILVSKFASSAAHVTGKKMVSSETGTWVAEHFTETLADLKYLFDDMFLSGVNRIMYHGTAYSPADAPWPGWLFYASTQMNPRHAIWHDVPALNAYVGRVQAMLQESRPDNDLLLYWPIHDLWHDAEGMVQEMSVHKRAWFSGQALGKTARTLCDRGYTFDYISDKQLQKATAAGEDLEISGHKYRAVVVPACKHLPLETLKKLLALQDAGATVVFEGQAPQDVPGLGDLEARRAEFKTLVSRVVPGDQLEAALETAGARREAGLPGRDGVQFVRRAVGGGSLYFIANRGKQRLDEHIALATPAARAAIFDPMTGQIGLAEMSSDGVRLQLEAGESLLVRTFEKPTASADPWDYREPAGEPVALEGKWNVRFLEGGPELPEAITTDKPASWTELGGEAVEGFAGTAVYTLRFDAPSSARAPRWTLDLGEVAQSARVRLNGQDLGTVFIPPFRVPVDELKPRDNVLEVEVTSTSANRIRDLDRRGASWKIFHDINIVNLDYKPFDASQWKVADAGLIGPVTLQAVKGDD